MKLAFDNHHLLLEHAGTKRVTINIIEQLKLMPDIELILLSPSYNLSARKGLIGKAYVHLVRFFWVQIHLPLLCFLKKADFLFSPEYYTPVYTHCKRAVIAHDANIRSQKEFINPIWFYCYYIPFIEYAIRKADLVFTVSEFSKKEVVELMNVDSAKVHVAYNGIDNCFLDVDTRAGTRVLKTGLVSKQYILFVGTFEARKNIERLIEAFALIKRKPGMPLQTKLAIVGKPSAGIYSDRNKQIQGLIKRLDLENDIVLCGYVSDQDLPYYYQNCALVAFPSLYEGFGLPIIEGFASGVPVLTSSVCSMPEIAGDAAILVDPYAVNDIANKLLLLMSDLELRNRLILAGKERVKKFTWEHCVLQMLSYIRPLIPN
jgi:glycosyltransferase involved in cell wall biosynthesis